MSFLIIILMDHLDHIKSVSFLSLSLLLWIRSFVIDNSWMMHVFPFYVISWISEMAFFKNDELVVEIFWYQGLFN